MNRIYCRDRRNVRYDSFFRCGSYKLRPSGCSFFHPLVIGILWGKSVIVAVFRIIDHQKCVQRILPGVGRTSACDLAPVHALFRFVLTSVGNGRNAFRSVRKSRCGLYVVTIPDIHEFIVNNDYKTIEKRFYGFEDTFCVPV